MRNDEDARRDRVAAAALAAQQGLKLDLRNRGNVAASRLEGEWRACPAVDAHLHGAQAKPAGIEGAPTPEVRTLSFRHDPTAFPEEVLRKIGARARMELTAYAMETMTFGGKTGPFSWCP